jgi:hypothetical protein
MQRMVIAFLFSLVAAACSDTGSRRHFAQSYGPYGCRQFTSCGACTPILGCGWCTIGGGGMCVDDPNDCAAAASFQWTWEPTGCPAANDAGTAGDAAGEANASTDAGVDAASEPSDSTDGTIDAEAVEAGDDAAASD